jgi:hypothetical protein
MAAKERRYWLRFDRRPAPWVSSHEAEDADLAEASRLDENTEPQSNLSTSVPASFRPAKQAAALQEAEEARKQQQIFVFEGSAGWIAWLDHRARTTGIRAGDPVHAQSWQSTAPGSKSIRPAPSCVRPVRRAPASP